MSRDSSPHQRQLSSVFASLGDEGRAKRVEDRIVSGITAGILLDGDRLPSEAEMASSLGVATMTAREALTALRTRGLVKTTRGREGGTFITLPQGDRASLLRERLAAMSRVELRDLGIHYAAIASTAAELAAGAADDHDLEILRRMLEPQPAGANPPGTVVGDFFLEMAALSQSARLTREHVRLHTDFGSLLSLAHADPGFDARMLALCAAILDAMGSADSATARRLVDDYVRAGVVWLIEAQADNAATNNPSRKPRPSAT
ncbi:FadR/GntR family transcriptional regulator [Paeniglutamicibacter sp. R2-26]|uniref:FadR/GntR family transcriptional regulator n=1 Tax=Paeniglutamicibacter sp. R2-26 TaxID=3144417 RepID=UPI003EE6FDC7